MKKHPKDSLVEEGEEGEVGGGGGGQDADTHWVNVLCFRIGPRSRPRRPRRGGCGSLNEIFNECKIRSQSYKKKYTPK